MTYAFTSTERGSSPTSGKATGVALVAFALLSLALLANHPSGAARTFADMLRDEAAHRSVDALVHGGFIVVLAGELVCFAVLAVRLGLQRPTALAGLVLTSIGAGFLMLSMLFDGLVIPAIAARYVDVMERQNDARALFVLIGAVIGFLMPAGLAFQAAGLASWSVGFARCTGWLRGVGIYGLVAALAILSGIAITAGEVPHVLMIAVVAIAIGYALIGVALARRDV